MLSNRALMPYGTLLYAAFGMLLWSDLPLPVKGAVLFMGIVIGAASPVSALSAMLMATPFVFDPVSLGRREFSLLELAIVFGGAGIGLRAIWDARSSVGRRRLRSVLRPFPMTVAVAVLLVAAIVSLVTLADTRYRPESLRELRLVIVEPLLFFAAARWVFADQRDRQLAATSLVAMGAVVGAYAIGQIVFGSAGVVSDGVRRATGPYPHPNNLALFLERAGILGAAMAIGRGVGWRWIAIAAAAALIGAGATFSRGAGLALLIGLIFVLIVHRRLRGVGVVLLLATVGGGVLLITVGDRVIDTGSTGDDSTRVLIWRAAIEMGLDHPVWGVGLDQFLTQYWPRYVDPAGWPERYTAHAHNLVLDVWLRLGILGLIALTGLGAALVGCGKRIVAARHQADPIAVGAVALLVTGIVHGMVDNGFFLPDLAVLTWFAAALVERTDVTLPAAPPTSVDGSGTR